MQASLLRELRRRRPSIRARWEALLRAEPVATPLALPDALVHLIDATLEEILATLEAQAQEPPQPHPGSDFAPPFCSCGRNPFLTYFTAAEQAIHEGLVLAQAASAPLAPAERDASLAELDAVFELISRREIEAFCGVCQFRHLALPAAEPRLAIQRW